MPTWVDRIGRRLKLRDLHVLMEVVKWGSMAKAARHLAISTPVVSKTITEMERTLGVPLLDRNPHGVEPTLYGRALIKRGIAVFDELKQGVEDLKCLADPTAGELRIGSTEPLAGGFVPAVIDRLNSKHPRVSFDIVQADFTKLRHELRTREIDLMIGRPSEPVFDEDLEAEILFDDRIVVVAGLKNRWAVRRKIEIAKLIDELWSLPPLGSVPRSAMHEAFRAAGLDIPQPIVSSPAFQVHTHLLSTGRFLTIMPESVVRFAAKDLPMKVLPVDLKIKLRPVLMIVLKNRTRSPVTDLFMQHAREVAKPSAQAN